jgi:hypothetical protein
MGNGVQHERHLPLEDEASEGGRCWPPLLAADVAVDMQARPMQQAGYGVIPGASIPIARRGARPGTKARGASRHGIGLREVPFCQDLVAQQPRIPARQLDAVVFIACGGSWPEDYKGLEGISTEFGRGTSD